MAGRSRASFLSNPSPRGLGYSVECVVRDLPCPPCQREDDPRERLYRMRQLSQGVNGLVRAAADLTRG